MSRLLELTINICTVDSNDITLKLDQLSSIKNYKFSITKDAIVITKRFIICLCEKAIRFCQKVKG